MDDDDEIWQRRIRQLYANIEELYSHVDVSVVMFDRHLVASTHGGTTSSLEPSLAELARRILETGEAQHDVAFDRTGRQRVHGYPIHDDHGIVGVACVVVDDGARRELFVRSAMAIFDGYRQNEASLLERERRAVEEAQGANQLRDQFLATVAHELKSPTTAILLWEQVLRDPMLDLATRTHALDAIRDSAAGQALLVADLLDVSRAITGKLSIDRQWTSIKQVLTMTIANARPRAKARNLQIVANVDDTLAVLGDSRRLRQVFDNLVSNAINSTAHGRITIRGSQNEDSILIDVSDTGRGISADFLPHVFEAFRQSHDRDSKNLGLGLGLAIARELVELHGGSISASSDGLGTGATFTVRLPRIRKGDREVSSVPERIVGVRVLVVDDDVRILGAVQVLLAGAGAIVTTAQSASAALLVLEAGQTDIIVSDIGLADEDGCRLVQRLRCMSGPMRALPAIAITANIADAERQRALAAGFDRYFTKPLDVALLISSISQLVSSE